MLLVFELREIRWVKNIDKKCDQYLSLEPEERRKLWDVGIGQILKWILKKQRMTVCAGFVLFKTWFSGKLL
jgi:hypothetical protein